MQGRESGVYEFGGFRVEAGRRVLLRAGNPVPLTPKVFDTLLYLVQRKGQLVEKDDLMKAIWPDTVVEENNLTQNISVLRRVLGESRGESRYILTVPGRGYRFVAEVERDAAESEPAARPVRLAVLPFETIGAGPEHDYLADGLTEETVAALGQVEPEHLHVIGRTSVMRYKASTKTLAEIGQELDATYLIESSIRAEGGRLRIISKLIRTRDHVQIWSASYNSEPSSMLTFQQDLSAAIAEQIRLRLSSGRVGALAHRQTRNAEAYDLYLRGRHFWHQLSPPTTKRAIEYFSKATQLDPEYALAWSGIADTLASTPINGDAPPLEVWPRAREAASRAVKAEPNLAETQASLGFVKFWLDWDWLAAERAFRNAIALDANYPLPHRMLGILCAHSGRHEEGRVAMRRARELDPLVAVYQALSAQVAFLGRDFEAAKQFARQAIVIDPEFWVGHLQLAQPCEQLGGARPGAGGTECGGAAVERKQQSHVAAWVFVCKARENRRSAGGAEHSEGRVAGALCATLRFCVGARGAGAAGSGDGMAGAGARGAGRAPDFPACGREVGCVPDRSAVFCCATPVRVRECARFATNSAIERVRD